MNREKEIKALIKVYTGKYHRRINKIYRDLSTLDLSDYTVENIHPIIFKNLSFLNYQKTKIDSYKRELDKLNESKSTR